jgi:hypothetical protein
MLRGGTRLAVFAATILAVVAMAAAAGQAACLPKDLPSPPPQDAVARVLAAQATCPKGAVAFLAALKQMGVTTAPTMVNFVGFHAPDDGAFFIFEIAASDGPPASAFAIERGDLLFGHFTTVTGSGKLVSNTADLVIELIAWDPGKQYYNFYELLQGDGWFYRGDSASILDDLQQLHRQRTASAPIFGDKLRCSGCHVNGGLVQKEMTPPYNDWFTHDRPLPLGRLKPDAFVKGRLADLRDADELTALVKASARRLADSPGYQAVLAARSMQEQLRPLFCPMELNIESDLAPVDDKKPTARIPSAFFVDPRLAAAEISIARPAYDAALEKAGSRLPRTPGRVDADHAWLTPVKAQSDIVAVDRLIERGVISEEVAVDVLAVDFANPVFSATRCGLLKLVPDDGGADLVGRLQDALRGASIPGATALLANLSDPAKDAAFHRQQAQALLASCQQRATDPAAVNDWYRLLAQRRVEVSDSEISKNPQGHILEDPNRIVFPSTKKKEVAGRLMLTAACEVK